MTTWLELAKEECARAEERLENAQTILQHALDNYEESPTRPNKIALAAATRLVKETSAEAEEWMV